MPNYFGLPEPVLSDNPRSDWSDLDGRAEPPAPGPDPYAYPLAASLPEPATIAPAPAAATQDERTPVLLPNVPLRAPEPVQQPAVVSPRKAAAVLEPVDDLTGLRLLIRRLRDR